MVELNSSNVALVSGGVDYYIEYNADKQTIGVGFKVRF